MSSLRGLPILVTRKENKSVYVNLFSTLSMVIDFLFSSINNDDNIFITAFTDKETFLAGLNSASAEKFSTLNDKHISGAYFLTKKNIPNSPGVVELAKDIHRLKPKFKKNTQHILLINESLLSDLTVPEIELFLHNIKQLANKREISITLCLYGHLGMVNLESKLMTLNQAIAGLSSMTAVDEQRFSYFVRFWLSSYGVTAGEEFLLEQNEQNKLEATRYEKIHAHETVKNKLDGHICYINKAALNQSEQPSKDMIVADDNQQLLTLLDNPQAATIIFSCTNQTEIQKLAINCYQLRNQFGNQLKVIIRETQQCLRYVDEKLFLRAGVNLIVPHQVPYPRFMAQVEAVQGQIMTRSLPLSLESLLKYSLKYGNKGYLQSNDFVQYCSGIITRSIYSDVDFSLVRLTLLPGMSAEECLRLCHIRRDGDVVTATNSAVYVLFSAIRKTDIDIAINHIFDFPVRDLFHSTTTFDTKEDLEREMRYITDNPIMISEEVSSLTIQQQIFAPSVTPMTDVPVLFAVKKAITTQETI